jgi:hypothetical protein
VEWQCHRSNGRATVRQRLCHRNKSRSTVMQRPGNRSNDQKQRSCNGRAIVAITNQYSLATVAPSQKRPGNGRATAWASKQRPSNGHATPAPSQHWSSNGQEPVMASQQRSINSHVTAEQRSCNGRAIAAMAEQRLTSLSLGSAPNSAH